MRDYNPETDFHVIQEAAAQEQTLTAVARAFTVAGLRWPYMQDGSRYSWQVDYDICRAWGRTTSKTLDEFMAISKGYRR